MSYNSAPFKSISSKFSNSPYTSTAILTPGAAPNSRLSCKSPVCLGLSLAVSTSIGYIVKHEQGTIFTLSPISPFHHIAFLFTPSSTGLKKTKVPQIISGCCVLNQLEGFLRVFFSSDNLSNGTQSKFLEAEGISGHIPIEGSTVQ